MKHDWEDTTKSLISPEERTCKNCGAVQTLEKRYLWMRLASKRWEPLVGRCRPENKNSKKET